MVLGLGFSDMELRIKAIGIYHAHSAYLNVLLESGIIGLIFYNSISITIIISLYLPKIYYHFCFLHYLYYLLMKFMFNYKLYI